ncbi:GGDEF domain-containing protein [Congregibacter sp.]|uniref:GGDEF domain-containing protein n=1 Tax=Congregibacter sp. TaxID=2744308 RepID=UPI003F6B51B2
MLYPRPDSVQIENWQSTVELLVESTAAEQSLLRVAYPTSTEIVAAAPGAGGRFTIGHREHRNVHQYSEEALQLRGTVTIADADTDARWDACSERRKGYRAYCGTALRWPDDEAFGTLDLLKARPFSHSQLQFARRLLENLGTGITAQLALLYHTQEQQYRNTYDALTGIPNRLLLAEHAHEQINQQQRRGGELWLLVWTIDELKALDHGADKDRLLRSVTERVRGCIRQSDTLARTDEHRFAILINDANEFIATAVADRIRRNIRRLSLNNAGKKSPGFTVGLTPFRDNESFDAWLNRGESALSAAITAGGNQTLARR